MWKVGSKFLACASSIAALLVSNASVAGPFEDIKTGQWLEIANSRLDSVDAGKSAATNPSFPADPPWRGSTGISAVIDAWSGAAYDTTRQRLMLFGGGHFDYGGNEIYSFDVATLTWQLTKAPYTSMLGVLPSILFASYPDWTPTPLHTYGLPVYAENVDRYMIMGSGYFNGMTLPLGALVSSNETHAFDPVSKKWDNEVAQAQARKPHPDAGYGNGGNAVYDSKSRVIWRVGNGTGARLQKYDPALDTWTNYGYVQGSYNRSLLYDSKRSRLVYTGPRDGVAGDLSYIDVSNPASPGSEQKAVSTGTAADKAPENASSGIGFAYDVSADKYVAWIGGQSGSLLTDVYVLNPDTWEWQRTLADSTNTVTPSTPSPNGTWGRWAYVPTKSAFILVNSVSKNVLIYKLSTAPPGASPPSISITPSPATIAPGQSSTLTWSTTPSTGVSCAAADSWTGVKAVSGSQIVGPLSATAAYTLTCAGVGGSRSVTAVVNVSSSASPAAPAAVLTATPTSVTTGGTVSLNWSATNATTCTASDGWTGTKSITGSESSSALSATTTFTIQCTGTGAPATQSVTVTVTSPATSPPPTTTPAQVTPAAEDSGGGALGFGWVALLAGLVLIAGCMASKDMQSTTNKPNRVAKSALGSLAILAAQSTMAAAPAMNVVSHSSSAQTNVPITFGQVFKPGDVPSTSTVFASTSGGTPLSVQVDKKATHADGSLRHAVVTMIVPSLAANGSQTIQLAATGTSSGSTTPVALSDLLATSFDADVQLNIGGTIYSASAKQLLQTGTPIQWLSGPLVSEWIVGGPVKTSGNVAHPHLAAYFHVRAYAGTPITRVRVDAVIENGWTFVSGATSYTYDATVNVGGAPRYTKTLTHYHHSRWHKRFWWGTDPQLYAQQDTNYLQDTGAVPRYPPLTPSATELNKLLQVYEPMEHGNLTKNFPDTGAQEQIGPLPRWTAMYVVSSDERAFNSMLVADDSAGSYSAHYRDEVTGKPVSIADHPNITLQFSQADGGGMPDSGGVANPNGADVAHQPSIAFVPYLQTGDYYYLEEMQFWTSHNHLYANPLPPYGYRQGAKGIFGIQVRGQAWSMRNLGQAAYATPDSHAYKAELVASVGHNLTYNEGLYPDNASANKLGFIRSYDGYQLFAPWMDDFYTWTMGYLVDLGFPATKMRDWKAKFPVGRMGLTDYCYLRGTAYHLQTGTSDTVSWPDFATLYQQNIALGEIDAPPSCPLGGTMIGYPAEPDGYGGNLRPALAVAVDAGVTGATDAWTRLITSTPQPDFSNYPNWGVIPRTLSSSNPSVTMTATPNPVVAGQSTTITWISLGATSCTASQGVTGWAGAQTATGTKLVGPIAADTTFSLTCTNSSGTVLRNLSVTTGTGGGGTTAPVVSLSVNSTSIQSGQSATITWSSTNATTCTASGGWTGTMATSGTQSVTPTATATYALSCTGAGGTTAAAPATLTVTGASAAATAPAAADSGGGAFGVFDVVVGTGLLGAALYSGRRRTYRRK